MCFVYETWGRRLDEDHEFKLSFIWLTCLFLISHFNFENLLGGQAGVNEQPRALWGRTDRGQCALLSAKRRNHLHCIIKDTLCLLRQMFSALSYLLCLLSDCALPNKAKQFAHVFALCWKGQLTPGAQEGLPQCPKKVAQTQDLLSWIIFYFHRFSLL